MMKTKFNILYEKVLHTLTEDVYGAPTTREHSGGFASGDRVALLGNVASSDWFKNQPEHTQEKIKEVAGSDLNIFVTEVKVHEGSSEPGANMHYLTIAQELAPGVLNQDAQLSIPCNLCEFLAPPNERAQAPIPDSWRGNERVTIKPEPVKLVGEDEAGDRSLPEKDTPGQKGGSYTSDYMDFGSTGLSG